MKGEYFWLDMSKKGKPPYYWNMNITQITFKLFLGHIVLLFLFCGTNLIISFFAFRLQM